MKKEILLTKSDLIKNLRGIREFVLDVLEDLVDRKETRNDSQNLAKLVKMICSLDIVLEMVENDS